MFENLHSTLAMKHNRQFLKFTFDMFEVKLLIFQITFQFCHSAVNLLTAQIMTLWA